MRQNPTVMFSSVARSTARALHVVREDRAAPSSATATRSARSITPRRVRVVDAALACIARQGTAKTTLDDVAREAGLQPGHGLPGLPRR